MQHLDKSLVDAVQKAVQEAEQPTQLAKRLLFWMDSLSAGDASLDNPADVSERLDLVLEKIILEQKESNEI